MHRPLNVIFPIPLSHIRRALVWLLRRARRALSVFVLIATLSAAAYADVLISDGFETGSASASWTQATPYEEHYTPYTSEEVYVTAPDPVHGGTYSAHYYTISGTNEITPIQYRLEIDPTAEELYVSYWDYFDGDYCWPSSSQKMVRIGHFDGATVNRKDFTFVTRTDGSNVGYEYQCSNYGEGICDTGLGTNSEDPHPLDAWVNWVVHIKLNSVGSSNGFIKLYKNSTLYLSDVDLNLRGSSDTEGFNTVWIGGTYSNLEGETLDCSGHRYLDDINIYDADPGVEPTPEPTAEPTPEPTAAPSTTVRMPWLW